MPDREAGRPHLRLSLPPPWEVLDPEQLPLHLAGQLLGLHEESAHQEKPWRPDLAARLECLLIDEDGDVAGVLLASLSASALPSGSRASAVPLTLLREVELSAGRAADLAVMEHVVRADGDVQVLMTFTTPNLPLLPVLQPAFAAIAGGARIV